ncbi:MAG: MFS transporter [bacterium]|nr:hypothetical protein [Deltaproteobacteria bacterium]MCP4905613.1 MFS transporter [bacterium]
MQVGSDTFFGRWRVTLAAFAAQGLGPGLFACYGLFVDPLAAFFEARHASLAMGMSMLLIIQAVMGPVLGPLLDRHSIRRIMLGGAALATTALFMSSRATDLPLLFVSYLFAVIGLTLYAPLPAIVLVTNHYEALRGRALSLAATGTSATGILLPLAVAQLLGHFDWRVALLSLAILVGGLSLSVFIVCIPRDSQARGSNLSGIETGRGPVAPTWEFMASRAFWIIGLTFSVLLGMAAFYAFSLAPHLREVGLTVEEASIVMSFGAFVSLVSKLGFASIADRIKNHLIAVTVGLLALQAVAWMLISTGETLALFLFTAGLYSMTIGPFLVLGPYLNSLYFREEIIGRVNGSQAPLVLPFALSAPPLAGLSYDLTGSYVMSFQGAVAVVLTLAALFLFLGRADPTRDSPPTERTQRDVT